MPRQPAAPPLAGWYVISLRPPGQHAAMRRGTVLRGAQFLALSTLRLRALPADATRTRALASSLLIATSPAAVRFTFAEPVPAKARAQPWYTPGAGTAAALQRRGVRDVHWPAHGADSDALLAMPALQRVSGRRIGVLTAPGGRDLIVRTLLRRGARVTRADVYVREALQPRADRLARLDRMPARSALMVSSGEALDALWTVLDPARRMRLARCTAVASSARLAMKLRALGFTKIVVAEGARPAQLLGALAENARGKGVPVR